MKKSVSRYFEWLAKQAGGLPDSGAFHIWHPSGVRFFLSCIPVVSGANAPSTTG